MGRAINERSGWLGFRIPTKLKGRLIESAKKNRRNLSEEALVAIEAYLAGNE